MLHLLCQALKKSNLSIKFCCLIYLRLRYCHVNLLTKVVVTHIFHNKILEVSFV